MNRPASQNRWPHISATVVLIAALTLAACAPAGTTTTLTTAPPATPTSSATPTTASPAAEDAAIEIARLFLEAYTAFDADKAASYLTDDALQEFAPSGGDGAGDVEGLRLQVRHLKAAGFKLLLDSCEEQDSSPPGTSVRCTYDYHRIRSDEIGLGPYSGSQFDITVLDGEIVSVSDHFVFLENGFSDQMWEPFAEWVAENYPEDGALMYENWPSIFMAQLTDESIELWEQRSREYVEVVGP
jgi:hypothetical protein